jgi:hypothetical protein
MEPNPQRKIVFNAPGKPFNTSTQNTQTSTPHTMMPPTGPMPGQPKVSTEALLKPSDPNANPAFRSFAHDIKSNVSEKGVSMAQIVMDEERRKQAAGTTTEDVQESEEKSGVLKVVLIVIGIIAILGGGVALFITFSSTAPVPVTLIPEDYSPIRAQKVTSIELRDQYKSTLIEAVRGIGATRISEENFVEIKLNESIGTTSVPVKFARLMEILETRIPDELLRSNDQGYVLGIYASQQTNSPFLMFSVDAFENAYVGMKAWERTMIGDIGALFMNDDLLYSIIGSSTPSQFQDKVYYNNDTRTVFGSNGKPVLVWAIVNRTQIIITKDGETLNALMKRITLENIKR